MSLKLFFSNQSKKFIKNQDKLLVKRILNRVNLLLKNPFPRDSKFLKNEEKLYRIRVGYYRILYRVNHATNKLIIFKIGKRGKVYD